MDDPGIPSITPKLAVMLNPDVGPGWRVRRRKDTPKSRVSNQGMAAWSDVCWRCRRYTWWMQFLLHTLECLQVLNSSFNMISDRCMCAHCQGCLALLFALGDCRFMSLGSSLYWWSWCKMYWDMIWALVYLICFTSLASRPNIPTFLHQFFLVGNLRNEE